MDGQDTFTTEQSDAVDLADYLKVLRARWWVIFVCVAALLGATVYVSGNTTPLYRATAKIVRQQGSLLKRSSSVPASCRTRTPSG